MIDYIRERVLAEAQYIADHNATIRQAGEALNISKSTVHMDINSRLAQIDSELYLQVRRILEYNYSVRHLRGGESTKMKHIINRRVKESYIKNTQ